MPGGVSSRESPVGVGSQRRRVGRLGAARGQQRQQRGRGQQQRRQQQRRGRHVQVARRVLLRLLPTHSQSAEPLPPSLPPYS